VTGSVVGIVAIPLGLYLALATDDPPQLGVYTVSVPGLSIALPAGSRFYVSGPTAALAVIIEPIVIGHGVPGASTANL
jgi:SulP family sulfate permease